MLDVLKLLLLVKDIEVASRSRLRNNNICGCCCWKPPHNPLPAAVFIPYTYPPTCCRYAQQ